MKEAWIAFIVLCNGADCNNQRRYSDKAAYSEQLCKDHARGWAIQMYTMTQKTYGYGCKKNDYEPQEVKP